MPTPQTAPLPVFSIAVPTSIQLARIEIYVIFDFFLSLNPILQSILRPCWLFLSKTYLFAYPWQYPHLGLKISRLDNYNCFFTYSTLFAIFLNENKIPPSSCLKPSMAAQNT